MERVKIIDKPKKVVSQAIECKFCGHFYLQPCNEVAQRTCRNIKMVAKKKPKKPRR